jgi:hypothetical protein
MHHLAETPAAKPWLEICRDPAFADRPERFEIDQKRALYFNAGAKEVWIAISWTADRAFSRQSDQSLNKNL